MKEGETIAVQTRAMVREAQDVNIGTDLELINKNALEPLSPQDVFLFEAIPSNKAVDCYYTQMAESSLRNFRDDLVEGRALMNSHRRHDTLPLGYSYDSVLNESNWVLTGKYFLQRGLKLGEVENDQVIRGIQGGTLRDVSIGFKPGWYRCTICGKDLTSPGCAEEPGNRCEHIPGVYYDRVLCTAWVEDGYLEETSIVFDGATPGAIIKKAMDAYKHRQIEPRDVERLEGVLGVRFSGMGGWLGGVPDLSKLNDRGGWVAPDPSRPAGGSGWDETDISYRYRVKDPALFHKESFRTVSITTGVSAVMAKLISDSGPLADKAMKTQSVVFDKKTFADMSSAKAWLSNHKDVTRGGDNVKDELITKWLEAETMVRWLNAEIEVWLNAEREFNGEGGDEPGDGDTDGERKVTLVAVDDIVKAYEKASGKTYHAPSDRSVLGDLEMPEFSKDASNGQRFVKDLVAATVQERIRAQGDGFDTDKYRDMLLGSRDVDFIRGELTAYSAEAGNSLYSGRRTDPGEPSGDGGAPPAPGMESSADVEGRLMNLASEEMKLVK